jgi:hypothetical protein
MRLNRTIRKACGPVGVVMILYYVISTIVLLRNNPLRHQPTEYYGQGGTLVASSMPKPQWGKRSSTVCGPEGCSPSSPDDSQESWTNYSDAWVYNRGGVEHGRIYKNGTASGFVQSQPSWYPSGMPQQFQSIGQLQQNRPTGDLPPPGIQPIGQGPLPPTGVNPGEVAKDKARVPSGVTINGSPATESLARSALSDSAKAQGLKDYDNALRLVVVGKDLERKPFVATAKPWADASAGKLIVQEYDLGDWQCAAHENALKSVPDYKQGDPFAYVQRGDGTAKAICYSPGEVSKVMGQLRPEIAPNFDAAKARAATQISNDWLIWASAAFVGLMGLIGAVTSKPQS